MSSSSGLITDVKRIIAVIVLTSKMGITIYRHLFYNIINIQLAMENLNFNHSNYEKATTQFRFLCKIVAEV
jgi:hypothetical protein